ncbi:MAG: DUF72 domain-containing protein [Acidobacteriota bacterium]|nr:DUF72 domain-containing protein [Acidobacteriota bacterium]
MARPGEIRIGISGWTYDGWRGTFYPKKLPHKNELSYAAGIFRSIEINGTFYSLQRPGTFAKWAAATPEDFVFAIKGSRFITHVQRLKEVRAPLANFFASGILRLGPKLGPFLWQLPPNFKFDAKRIEAFLKILPRDTESGAALARRHDKRVSGRAWMKASDHAPLRHSVEIRNKSFAVPEFVELLREYGVALVCADTVEWPRLMDLTSNFVYCRLHGSERLYASGYDDRALDHWAERVVAWADGREPKDAERAIDRPGPKLPKRDVFVYFDNDAKVRAPFDAQGLMARVRKLS